MVMKTVQQEMVLDVQSGRFALLLHTNVYRDIGDVPLIDLVIVSVFIAYEL